MYKIGVDIFKIERMQAALKTGKSYLDYAFTLEEQGNSKYHNQEDYYYASLFALKEATFKSLNIYWHKEMRWTDFNIISMPNSHPNVKLAGKTKEIAMSIGVHNFSLSNSYDDEYVIGTVLCMYKTF